MEVAYGEQIELFEAFISRDHDYQRVLGGYAIKRFLYRLGRSHSRNRFAIKSATLFKLLNRDSRRPTKDLDMLGLGCRPSMM
jgi:hypothetical protein